MSKLTTYYKELEEWYLFLNLQMSLVFFTLGSLALSQPKEDRIFWMIFIFVFSLVYSKYSNKFPKLLTKLKAKNITREQNYIRSGLMRNDLGFKVNFTKLLPFTMSVFFIVYVYYSCL
jgi:hypothetical protein